MSEISATLGLKLGDIAGTVNRMADAVRTKLEPLDDVNKSFGKLRKSLAPLAPYARVAFAGVQAAAAVAAAGVGAALAGVGIGLKKAMDTENLRVSFKVLLGDADAATAMVQQLEEFADESPFDMSSVVTAGKQLLAFGIAAKDVQPLLRDLGDLAAGMDAPLDQVADTFGRLKSGQFGQAFNNLKSLGITKSDLEQQGLVFDQGGSFQGSAEQAMEAVRAIIQKKFGGTMKELSMTTSSQLLGLQERAGKFLEEFAKPINDQLGPFIERVAGYVKSLIPWARAAGEYVSAAIKVILGAFSSGELPALALAGLQMAFGGAANYLLKLLVAGFAALIAYVGESLKTHIAMLGVLTHADFWKGMGLALLGIAAQFGNKLLEFIASLMESVSFIPGVGGALRTASQSIRSFAQENQQASQDVRGAGMDMLAPHLDTMRKRQAEMQQNVASAFLDGMKGEDLFDLSAGREKFAAIGERIRALADPAIAARNRKLNLPDTASPSDIAEKDSSGGRRPSATRLMALSGFGLFVKDPLAEENRRQTKLLEEIARNTQSKSDQYPPRFDPILRLT